MNAPSLFLLPERSTGELDIKNLSDQTIMETLVDPFPDEFQANFKNANGDFKDVCKWSGVQCNGRRHVVDISWDDLFPETEQPCHDIHMDLLPPRLKAFLLVTNPFGKGPMFKDRINSSALPRTIEEFRVVCQAFDGTMDFRRLPPRLGMFNIQECEFTGTADMTSLPKALKHFCVAVNHFTGSLNLQKLPRRMVSFDARECDFSRGIDLSRLPPTLETLNLVGNSLSGSVYLEKLPRAMVMLLLDGNHFGGKVRVTKPPPALDVISLQDNAFEGTAVIARSAFEAVELDRNRIECAVDEKGCPCKIPMSED